MKKFTLTVCSKSANVVVKNGELEIDALNRAARKLGYNSARHDTGIPYHVVTVLDRVSGTAVNTYRGIWKQA